MPVLILAGAIFLRCFWRRGLHRRTHDDLAAFGTRDSAADQEQVTFDVDLDDLEVFDRAAHDTHVARHALALEHAARGLALADGARRTVRHGHAVRGMVAGEVVTLHRAGEALADRGARDVDDGAHFEQARLDFAAHGEVGALFFLEAEFDHRLARLDIRFRVVTRGGLRQKLRTLLAERNLNGAISVLVDGFHLSDAVRQHFDDGYRNRLARIRKDASHAGLAANKSNAHDYPLVPAIASIGDPRCS